MLGVILILIILSIICKFLVSYIKAIRTGDPNESDLTYWMFSYDFKSKNKEWFPEEKHLLKRKRNRIEIEQHECISTTLDTDT